MEIPTCRLHSGENQENPKHYLTMIKSHKSPKNPTRINLEPRPNNLNEFHRTPKRILNSPKKIPKEIPDKVSNRKAKGKSKGSCAMELTWWLPEKWSVPLYCITGSVWNPCWEYPWNRRPVAAIELTSPRSSTSFQFHPNILYSRTPEDHLETICSNVTSHQLVHDIVMKR